MCYKDLEILRGKETTNRQTNIQPTIFHIKVSGEQIFQIIADDSICAWPSHLNYIESKVRLFDSWQSYLTLVSNLFKDYCPSSLRISELVNGWKARLILTWSWHLGWYIIDTYDMIFVAHWSYMVWPGWTLKVRYENRTDIGSVRLTW